MVNNQNITVVVSNQNSTKIQVFAINNEDRFVFGLKEFTDKTEAMKHGNYLSNRFSCGIEVKLKK